MQPSPEEFRALLATVAAMAKQIEQLSIPLESPNFRQSVTDDIADLAIVVDRLEGHIGHVEISTSEEATALTKRVQALENWVVRALGPAGGVIFDYRPGDGSNPEDGSTERDHVAPSDQWYEDAFAVEAEAAQDMVAAIVPEIAKRMDAAVRDGNTPGLFIEEVPAVQAAQVRAWRDRAKELLAERGFDGPRDRGGMRHYDGNGNVCRCEAEVIALEAKVAAAEVLLRVWFGDPAQYMPPCEDNACHHRSCDTQRFLGEEGQP